MTSPLPKQGRQETAKNTHEFMPRLSPFSNTLFQSAAKLAQRVVVVSACRGGDSGQNFLHCAQIKAGMFSQ